MRLVLEEDAINTYAFKETTQRWLKLVDIETAEFYENEQAVLTIKANTKGLGATYYDTKTGKNVGKRNTGYQIKGTLSLETPSGFRYSKKFKGKIGPSQYAIGGSTSVPFEHVFYQQGSFAYTLAKMMQELFGFEVLLSASAWNHYYTNEVVKILMKESGGAAVEPLLTALKNDSPFVREAAVSHLGHVEDPRAVEPLISMLHDQNQQVRLAAARALGNFRDQRAVEPLINALSDSGDVAYRAAQALGNIKDGRAVGPLLAMARYQFKHVGAGHVLFSAPIKAVSQIGGPGLDSLLVCLNDNILRDEAIVYLGVAREKRAVAPLIALLYDDKTRRSAIMALGRMGDKRATAPLMSILGDQFHGQN